MSNPTIEFNKLSGRNDEMKAILCRLGFEVKGNQVVAPYYRIDIEHKADIAEEIARIWGYNRIPETAIKGKANGKTGFMYE